jgi:hypothetical protein
MPQTRYSLCSEADSVRSLSSGSEGGNVLLGTSTEVGSLGNQPHTHGRGWIDLPGGVFNDAQS